MDKPHIVVTNEDGTTTEREMNDLEFADYKTKVKGMSDHIADVHAKIQDRAAKLANP